MLIEVAPVILEVIVDVPALNVKFDPSKSVIIEKVVVTVEEPKFNVLVLEPCDCKYKQDNE